MTGNKDHSILITGCHIRQSSQHELMHEVALFSALSFLKMASINMILKGKVHACSNGTVAGMYICEYPYHTCTLLCFRQQLVYHSTCLYLCFRPNALAEEIISESLQVCLLCQQMAKVMESFIQQIHFKTLSDFEIKQYCNCSCVSILRAASVAPVKVELSVV